MAFLLPLKAWLNSLMNAGYTCNVDVLSATAKEHSKSPASSFKSLENIGVCIVNDKYDGDDMLPIENSAKKLHRLLEGKYGYKMMPDPYSGARQQDCGVCHCREILYRY